MDHRSATWTGHVGTIVKVFLVLIFFISLNYVSVKVAALFALIVMLRSSMAKEYRIPIF